jgi:hypothetical protein
MCKNVIWNNQAKAQLRAIDQPTALRILHALPEKDLKMKGSEGVKR